METDNRTKLLEVAARIFAQSGYRGTTTRGVAQEAGVNEVTLFRHFGSKDALIREAMNHLYETEVPTLPAEPGDPTDEVMRWARAWYEHMHARRRAHRKLLGEFEEHPEIMDCTKASTDFERTGQYFARLQAEGRLAPDADIHAATHLLLGALFAHAVYEDMLEGIPPREQVIRQSVSFVLRALGATSATQVSSVSGTWRPSPEAS